MPNKEKEVITYYLRPLDKPIVVNDRLIKYVGISSHCDKHFKHGITRELIIEMVEMLHTRYFPFSGKQPKKRIISKIIPKKTSKDIN